MGLRFNLVQMFSHAQAKENTKSAYRHTTVLSIAQLQVKCVKNSCQKDAHWIATAKVIVWAMELAVVSVDSLEMIATKDYQKKLIHSLPVLISETKAKETMMVAMMVVTMVATMTMTVKRKKKEKRKKKMKKKRKKMAKTTPKSIEKTKKTMVKTVQNPLKLLSSNAKSQLSKNSSISGLFETVK